MDRQRLVAAMLILLSLLAALPVLMTRVRLEGANDRVDLVIDTRSFVTLAQREGYPLDRLLRELAEAGVTGAIVQERDLRVLHESGEATVRLGREIRSTVASMANPHPLLRRLVNENLVKSTNTYVYSEQIAVMDEVEQRLRERLPEGAITRHDYQDGAAGPLSLLDLEISPEFTLQSSQWVMSPANPSVGFAQAEFQQITDAGLRPVPRPRNRESWTAEAVQELFEQIDLYGPTTGSVIFEGGEVTGYPNLLSTTAEQFRARGIVPILIESATQLAYTPQAGHQDLAAMLGYQTNRLYAMTQLEIDSPRFSPGETVDKWWRAAVERNIRTLFLRPFFRHQDPGRTLIETNIDRFGELADRLQRSDFELGAPRVFDTFLLGRLQRAALGVGVAGAVLLWLTFVWPLENRFYYLLAAVGALGAAGMGYLLGERAAQLLALVAAVIFPTLGATINFYRWNRGGRLIGAPGERMEARPGSLLGAAAPGSGMIACLREAVVATVVLSVSSLFGGLLVASILGDVRYMLEFLYFRGVKFSFFLPLVLVPASYVLVGREGGLRQRAEGILHDLRGYLNLVLTYGYVVVGVLAMVAGFWYIQRSGNQPLVPVPAWELQIRAWLEETLLARPRTKEFLIGYPAMMLGAAIVVRGWRNWAIGLSLVGVTAGVSVVNSFSHLRTPVLISLLRWTHGLWIGLLLGVVGTAVVLWALDWVRKQERSERI